MGGGGGGAEEGGRGGRRAWGGGGGTAAGGYDPRDPYVMRHLYLYFFFSLKRTCSLEDTSLRRYIS